MRRLVVQKRVRLAASAERLWPLMSDTPRLNAFIGAGALDVEATDGRDGARFVLKTKVSGFPLEYRELPFEWVENRTFSFRRLMIGGLVGELRVRYDFAPGNNGGTTLGIELSAEPRSALLRPLVKIVVTRNARGIVRYARAVDRHLGTGHASVFPPPQIDRAALERPLRELAASTGLELAERLASLIREADDTAIAAIRPYQCAASWKAPRDQVLRACLNAVKVGLLEMRWAVLCPSCNQAAEELPSLADLTQRSHCHTCDLGFGIELDRSVEALFRPHGAIRVVERRPFCVGGPALTPHVVAQSLPDASGVAHFRAPDAEGRYRLFVRGGSTAIVDVVAGGADSARVSVAGDEITPRQLGMAPGGAIDVDLSSDEDSVRHVKLERTDFHFYAATAYHVTLLPEFRAQFGADALRPGLALGITRSTVLFSDLCGSTALYSKVGDAAAFGIVTDCLNYGRALVETHRGVVVKTMGDAVMAVFGAPEDALRAGAAMVRDFPAFKAHHPQRHDLDIKVGLFTGPCAIVTANGVLDYFGQVVNTAARIQQLAGAGELVVPLELAERFDAPEGTRYLEPLEMKVKGIEEALRLWKLGPTSSASRA